MSRNGGRRLSPTFVGEADLGGRLALLGSDGQCVFAHSVHGKECAKEVWAAWRALFLPHTEGTGNGAGV